MFKERLAYRRLKIVCCSVLGSEFVQNKCHHPFLKLLMVLDCGPEGCSDFEVTLSLDSCGLQPALSSV